MNKLRTGVLIRAAREEDIPFLVEISQTSVTEDEVAGFGSPASESVLARQETLLASWSPPNRVGDNEIYIAEVDGSPVAIVQIEDRGPDLELVDIDVRRDLQGKGIGTKLVQYVEEMARERGKGAVTLGTSRNAQGVPWKSLPWWQSRGYRVTHEEENDWTRSIGPGAREIRMRKSVS